jgi:uncharacterized protein
MARHPVAGRVKTRLAAVVGDERACMLARAFILDLADRLRALAYPVTWSYAPPEAPFATLVPGARCQPQVGVDLGARMAHAIAVELAAGAPSVLVIGSDVPHVPAACLDEAAAALAAGTDVVLGPARDGGYYLIGLAAMEPALFRDLAWGTGEVLAATRTRAAACGLTVHLLPAGFDVDGAEDLDRLRGLIARGEADLPRTGRLLGASAAPPA